MFLWMNVFTLCIWLACDSQRHERLQRIRYWFTSNHIPFRYGCRPREASRLESKTHEAEAKPHEADAEADATTHEAEAEVEARFFGLEAEARPRGLASLHKTFVVLWNIRPVFSLNASIGDLSTFCLKIRIFITKNFSSKNLWDFFVISY